MKKLTQFLLCIGLMLGLCTFTSFTVSAKDNIGYEVLLTDEDTKDGDYKEYLIIYYNESNDLLTAIQDETVFVKANGYDKQMLDDNGPDIIEQVYPGFKDYTFGSWKTVDETDTVSFIILFEDLTNAKNLRQMYDAELIIPEDKDDDGSRGVDAPYFIKSIEKNGGKKLSSSEIKDAGLHIQEAGKSSSTTDNKTTTTSSEKIVNQVLLTDEDSEGDYKEYLVIYYSNKDNRLHAIQDESVFVKANGYDRQMLEDNGAEIIEQVYPGFKDYSFGSWKVEEDADTVSIIILFNDLTDAKNLRQMYDDKLIIPEDANDDGSKGVDAPYFIDSIKDGGGKVIAESDVAGTKIHIQDIK